MSLSVLNIVSSLHYLQTIFSISEPPDRHRHLEINYTVNIARLDQHILCCMLYIHLSNSTTCTHVLHFFFEPWLFKNLTFDDLMKFLINDFKPKLELAILISLNTKAINKKKKHTEQWILKMFCFQN